MTFNTDDPANWLKNIFESLNDAEKQIVIQYEGVNYSGKDVLSLADKTYEYLLINQSNNRAVCFSTSNPFYEIAVSLGIWKFGSARVHSITPKVSTGDYANDLLCFNCFKQNNEVSFDHQFIKYPYYISDTAKVVLQAPYYRDQTSLSIDFSFFEAFNAFCTQQLKIDFSSTLFLYSEISDLSFPYWVNALISKKTISYCHYGDNHSLESLYDQGKKTLVLPLHLLIEIIIKDGFGFLEGVERIISFGEEVFESDDFKTFLKERSIGWYNFYGFPDLLLITTVQSASSDKKYYSHMGKPSPYTKVALLTGEHKLALKGSLASLWAAGSGKATITTNSNINVLPNSIQLPQIGDFSFYKTPYAGFWNEAGLIEFDANHNLFIHCGGHKFSEAELERYLNSFFHVLPLVVLFNKDKSPRVYGNELDKVNTLERIHDFAPWLKVNWISLKYLPYLNDGKVDREKLRMLKWIGSDETEEIRAMLSTHFPLEPIDFEIAVGIAGVEDISLQLSDFSVPSSLSVKKILVPETSNSKLSIIEGELFAWQDEPRSLGEALKRTAEKFPDKVNYIIDQKGQVHTLSYKELQHKASRIATYLTEQGLAKGDHVILVFENEKSFILTFWGCIWSGMVPVPLSISSSMHVQTDDMDRFKMICQLLQNPYVLTDPELLTVITTAGSVDSGKVLAEDWGNVTGHEYPLTMSSEEDEAILLFTSGSTGIPKGVVQTHRNILIREISTKRFNGFSEREISLNWMPLEHVGGLVMFHILDVFQGATFIQVCKEYILADPLRWLDLLSLYRVTVTWAPSFAYGLITESLKYRKNDDWDLSCLHFILNGGESINQQGAKHFLSSLSSYNLRAEAMKPSWGMSETCSGVFFSHTFNSSRDSGLIFVISDNTEKSFVDLGVPIPGVSMRITDSGGKVVGQGTIGNVEIKGGCIIKGYYHSEELNETSFTTDGWFITGDQGLLLNDRFAITGRTKNIIIVNGINFSSIEIEELVAQQEAVIHSCVAAIGFRNNESNTDELCVFYSTEYEDKSLQLEQIETIIKAVNQKFGIRVSIVIPIARQNFPRTSIGKIQHAVLRDQFERGDFNDWIKEFDRSLNKAVLPSWFFKKEWKPEVLNSTFKTEERIFLIIAREIAEVQGLISFCNQNEMSYLIIDHRTSIEKQMLEHDKPFTDLVFWSAVSDDLDCNIEFVETILFWWKKINAQGSGTIKYLNFILNVGLKSVDYSGMITGLVKSAAQEFSGVRSKIIRVKEFSNVQLNAVWEEIFAIDSSSAMEVLYENGKRSISKIKKIPHVGFNLNAHPVKENAIYIVTGGLGGLGVQVCLWLSSFHNVKILIVGETDVRDSSDKEKSDKRKVSYNYLELQGVSFIYRFGDISSHSFIESAAREAEAFWGLPVEGVFHLAGRGNLLKHWSIMDQHLLKNESIDTFLWMYYPKVNATLGLHAYFENKKDALFVTFSSVSAEFGASTFSAYASANSFLIDYTHYRRRLGYTNSYCLVWSTWEDIGMSAGNPLAIQDLMKSSGYDTISIPQGMASLSASLCQKDPVVFIGINDKSPALESSIDVEFHRQFQAMVFQSPGLSKETRQKLHKSIQALAYDIPLEFKGDLHTDSLIFENEDELYLSYLWIKVLGQKSLSHPQANFFEAGGNSLKASKLIAFIRSEMKVDISLGDFFRMPVFKQLAKHIAKFKKNDADKIPKATVSDHYKLSFAQQRLFLIQNFDLNSVAYNVPLVFPLPHPSSDYDKIENAFVNLIKRHEALRTSFEFVNGEAVQRIHSKVDFNISTLQIRHSELTERIKEQVAVFALDRPPLLRVVVFEDEYKQSVVFVDMHHIITDGWSQGLLMKDFMDLYKGIELPELEYQYKDFSQWQNTRIESGAISASKEFWRSHLDQVSTGMNLPLDHVRPSILTYEGKSTSFSIDEKLYQNLLKLSQRENATVFMILKAAFSLFLSKIANQSTVVVGIPVSGRSTEAFYSVVGMFVNTLPVKVEVEGERTFKAFLQSIKNNMVECLDHQEYPVEKIIDELALDRNPARNPLFDVLFVYNESEIIYGHGSGYSSSERTGEYFLENHSSKVDLSLKVVESDVLNFNFEYNTNLFSLTTIEVFIQYFKNILAQSVESPLSKLRDMKLFSVEEENRFLDQFSHQNGTHQKDEKETLIDLWERQVASSIDDIAIIHEEVSLTYAEVSLRVNKTADMLLKEGVLTGDVVALLLNKSPDMVITMLAVMKAGAAYLPIDPQYPSSRITYLLEDSDAKILFTDVSVSRPEGFSGKVINTAELAMPDVSALPIRPDSSNLAYTIYTSGSTGLPKGVLVTHGAIVNTLKWRMKYYNFSKKDVTLQLPSYAFDSSVEDIFTVLFSGGKLVIPNADKKLDLSYLHSLIVRNAVTNLLIVPSFYQMILDTNPSVLKDMRFVTLAGEGFSSRLVEMHFELIPQVSLYNEYGPTENAVCSTVYKFETDRTEIRIGNPIDNVWTYVLDQHLNLCPPGIAGELYLSGKGLALGYHRKEELTSNSFLMNPFMPGTKMYKTGDWVKWTNNHQLVFEGRRDEQIKIRGYRIELAEIERTFLDTNLIEWVLVIPVIDNGIASLHAFYMAVDGVSDVDLRGHISGKLPHYMIPQTIQKIEEIPVTPNGKTDKQKLKALILNTAISKEQVGPASIMEEQLLQIWKQVLQRERISVEDHFFDIGGNSLNLIMLGHQIKECLGIEVTIVKLFQYSTIRLMAQFLSSQGGVNIESDESMEDSLDILGNTLDVMNNHSDEY